MQGQLFDAADGPPKLSEAEVPAYQQMIVTMCDTPEQAKEAQAALDARDGVKLVKILTGR